MKDQHDYEPSQFCTNYADGPTELPEGDDGCMHPHYSKPHCGWCGEASDFPWHTTRSR